MVKGIAQKLKEESHPQRTMLVAPSFFVPFFRIGFCDGGEEWKWEKKSGIIKTDEITAKTKEKLKDNAKVHIPLSNIRLDNLTFDEEHINKEDAQRFIKQAKVSFTRWNGKYVCYVGSEGSTYVDTQKKKIGTCFKRDEYDENTLNFIKEVEKVEDRLSTDEGKD